MKQYGSPKISNQVIQQVAQVLCVSGEQDNVLYHRSLKYRSSV